MSKAPGGESKPAAFPVKKAKPPKVAGVEKEVSQPATDFLPHQRERSRQRPDKGYMPSPHTVPRKTGNTFTAPVVAGAAMHPGGVKKADVYRLGRDGKLEALGSSFNLAAHAEGDTVVSKTDQQGLQKGQNYKVHKVDAQHTPFGQFVTYHVKHPKTGQVHPVTNGHIVLGRTGGGKMAGENPNPGGSGKPPKVPGVGPTRSNPMDVGPTPIGPKRVGAKFGRAAYHEPIQGTKDWTVRQKKGATGYTVHDHTGAEAGEARQRRDAHALGREIHKKERDR